MRTALAAATGLLLSASPVQAQEAAATPTIEDDLDCAIVLAAVLGAIAEDGDPEARAGVMAGVVFFIGRYEGAGGSDLETAMVDRFEQLDDEDINRLRPTCAERMNGIGARLGAAGNAITEIEKRRAKTGQ